MNWPDDDAEVQQVIAENGGRFRYRGGRWYGGINHRTGRWDLRVSADPADSQRLTAQVYEHKMERQRQEQQEQEQEQATAGAEPRTVPGRRGWGAAAATAMGAHAAAIMAGGIALVTPVLAQVISTAVQPLGGTGQALQSVGMGVVNFISESVRSVSYMGGALIGLALYPILGAALSTALGFLTAAGGQILGNIGRLLGEAFQGLVGIFTDISHVGRETADTIMSIAYSTGIAAEEATRLTMSLEASGVGLQTIQQMFGRWEARPEIMGTRLAVLGVDYERAMREGDLLLQLHDRLAAMPDIMRVPMLQATLGPGGAAMLPQIMRPREELEEAQRWAERWGAGSEVFEEMQRHVEAVQHRVGFLGQMLRLHLLEGFLPVMQRGLEMLLSLWDRNREVVLEFLQVTAPEMFLRGVTMAIDWIEEHWEGFLQGARDLKGIFDDIVAALRTIGDVLGALGDLWPFGGEEREETEGTTGRARRAGLGLPGGERERGGTEEEPRRPSRAGLGLPGGERGRGGTEEEPRRPSRAEQDTQGPLGDIWSGMKVLGGIGIGSLLARRLGLGRLLGSGVSAAGGVGGLLGRAWGVMGGRNLGLTMAAAWTGYQGYRAYEAGREGRAYEGPDPFWSGLGLGAATGFRFGGAPGAIIGAGLGAILNPVLMAGGEILGARARVRRTEEEIGPIGAPISAETVQRRLEEIGSPRAAAEAEEKRANFFNELRNVFSPEAWAREMARLRQQQERVEQEVKVTVEPSEDFLFRIERRLITRNIEESWRELQRAMS